MDEVDGRLVPIQEALGRPGVAFVCADRFDRLVLSVVAAEGQDLFGVVVVPNALKACLPLEAHLDALAQVVAEDHWVAFLVPIVVVRHQTEAFPGEDPLPFAAVLELVDRLVELDVE